MTMPRRFWKYSRESWEPLFRWFPYFGGDEWGRKTIVLPIPFSGYLVFAYRSCHCEECTWGREYLKAHWRGEFSEHIAYKTDDIFNEGRDFYRVVTHDPGLPPVTEKIS